MRILVCRDKYREAHYTSGDTVEELPCKLSKVQYADLCAPAAWPRGDSGLRREALYCTAHHGSPEEA